MLVSVLKLTETSPFFVSHPAQPVVEKEIMIAWAAELLMDGLLTLMLVAKLLCVGLVKITAEPVENKLFVPVAILEIISGEMVKSINAQIYALFAKLQQIRKFPILCLLQFVQLVRQVMEFTKEHAFNAQITVVSARVINVMFAKMVFSLLQQDHAHYVRLNVYSVKRMHLHVQLANQDTI